MKKDKKLLNTKRSLTGEWPDLEAALFEWQQRVQQTDAIITGDIIKAQAAKLWASLLQYADVEQLKWLNGWLNRFKLRFNIREFVRYGEGGSAAIDDPNNIQ